MAKSGQAKKTKSALGQTDLFKDFFESSSETVAAKGVETPKTIDNSMEVEPVDDKIDHSATSDRMDLAEDAQVYSVGELSQAIRQELRDRFRKISVKGEVTDFRGAHRSGHMYFSIKDNVAQMRVVMWKGQASRLKFELESGLEVIIQGKIDYYPGSGSLQIVADTIEPVGIGSLQLKFEQLKDKLQKEGLFASERKRDISAVNWHVGIVSGRGTAAFSDMIKVLRTRFPLAEVSFFHAAVQGERAPSEIIKAVELANRYSVSAKRPIDVLLVGRGGGSYEDLFCFNDENLARALADSKIPVVSAVGHEIDFTIADFVADKRAATPSHAAQLVVPEISTWTDRLTEIRRRLVQSMSDNVYDLSQKIDYFFSRLQSNSPQNKIVHQREILISKKRYLLQFIGARLNETRNRLQQFELILRSYSAEDALKKGFALVFDDQGKIKRRVVEIKTGDKLRLRLSDGEVPVRAE